MRITFNGSKWLNGGVYNIKVTPKTVKIIPLDPDNLGTFLNKAIVVKRDNTTWLFKIETLEDDKIVIYNRTSGKPMIFLKQT